MPSNSSKKKEKNITVESLMAKARSLTSDVEESAALDAIEEEKGIWSGMNAVLAPYDPKSLLKYIEITPHLKPCILSMAHNIDGYGYRSKTKEPWMDTVNDDEAVKAIVEALTVEAWVTAEEEELALVEEREELEQKIETLKNKNATVKTIRKYEKRLKILEKQEPEELEESSLQEQAAQLLIKMRSQLQREGYLFKSWFDQCCSEMSFVELRKAVREDVESHGWGTIEWLRDKYGRLKRLQYVPAYTVRPLQDIGEFINVVEDDSVTPFVEREIVIKRRFRIYVQQVGGSKVYFKSPQDPRVVSRTTGKVYDSIAALRAPTDAEPPGEGKKAIPANELMWMAKHDPTTPCPPPDWIGNLLAVLGVREADETNYFYLNSNAIPSGLIFIHGGTVPKATKERLEHRIKHEVQGAENAGKMLVIEARPGAKAAPGEKTMLPAITFQSLREAHQQDALFTEYDKRGSDRIGASFRLSPMLRGYTPSDLNRATAFAALDFTERQVFFPAREAFDWGINKFVMPELGIKLLLFQSNSPPTTSTEELGNFISATAPHGTFTPAELREIAGEAINKELVKLDEEWTKQPLQLTLNDSPENSTEQELQNKISCIVREELEKDGISCAIKTSFVDGEVSDADK